MKNMPGQGRKPKSRVLRVLSGQLPLTKDALVEINEPFSPPVVPSHFSARERAVWDETIKLLKPMKVLKNTDTAVLGAYCSAYVRWQDAETEIQKTKTKKSRFLVADQDGKSGVNPLLRLSREAQKDMLNYATMLSMTPAARLKMVAAKGKEEEVKNPFEKLKEEK